MHFMTMRSTDSGRSGFSSLGRPGFDSVIAAMSWMLDSPG
jgi:hypothetical protein